MARKTKESKDEIKPEKKVAVTKKASTTKKTISTKEVTKAKKSASTKKSTNKKSDSVKKSAAVKKSVKTRKNTSSKNTSSTRPNSKTAKKVEFQTEYYDLPYSYNNTVVKILAQTPKTLFVYWEISEDDRNNFKSKYGDRFFEVTKPVLVVYNNTMHYSFEIDINDFANSWYIDINDSYCDYTIELGRKPLPIAYSSEEEHIPYYIYMSSSNKIEVPNNHILFNYPNNLVQFRNIKTNEIINKEIKQFKFITNLGIMTIHKLFQKLYPDENFEYDDFVRNPSSGLTSSGTFITKSR